jgi:streptogramin lyase
MTARAVRYLLALAVAGVLALALGASATLADQVPVVAPTPGMVQEFSFPGEDEYTSAGYPIALGPDGSAWFPEEITASRRTIIARMTPSSLAAGQFMELALAPTASYGDGVGGLALGADGDMWFTDYEPLSGSFIGRITPTGEWSRFALPGGFNEPLGIALGADGAMWFTNAGEGMIGRIDATGSISEYTIASEYQTNLPLGRPIYIARGSDGAMWFTDDGGFIGKIISGGVVLVYLVPSPGGSPSGIALGPEGDMWFTEQGVGRIGRITPGGVISEFEAPSVGDSIALGSDGNMWFTEEPSTNAIGRITPAGTVTSFAPIAPNGEGVTQLIAGNNGDLWLREGQRIGRFVIPLLPVDVGLPVVSGEAVEGGVLSVSDGLWSNGPGAFGYQWQLCDGSGGGCVDLGGEVAGTHVLGAGDVGHTLRVLVTASGVGGSASVLSGASGVVRAAAPVPAGPSRLVVKPAVPVVGSTMTWSFGWARAYTVVESLVAHGLPVGGVVEIVCRGRGCPFVRRRFVSAGDGRRCRGRGCSKRGAALGASANFAGLFRGRRLGVGARITVSVTRSGWTGKSFAFAVRADGAPRVRITCLSSGSNKPAGEC